MQHASGVEDGDGGDHRGQPHVGGDGESTAREAVDHRPDRQGQEGKGKAQAGDQQPDRHRTRLKAQYREGRQGELADGGADLADRLAGPQ